MTIKTFLATYWIYIAALGLAIWTVYKDFKSKRTERKINLQTVYIELTKIINNFQAESLKHFRLESEYMVLILGHSEDMKTVKGILKNVTQLQNTEWTKKLVEFTNSITKLALDLKETTDPILKSKVMEDIKQKSAAMSLLSKNFLEERTKDKQSLDNAKDITETAAKKLSDFNDGIPQRIVSLSIVVTSLINELNSSPAWKLTASRSTVKMIDDLRTAALTLNYKILEMTCDGEKIELIELITILNSEEFKNVFEISENAIKKMRSEIV